MSVMSEDHGGSEHFDIEQAYLPSESQMVLMCLDYLRDLRRAYSDKEDLLDAEGLHADWLTLAIYALGRSFSMQGSATARAKSNSNAIPGTFGIPNYNQITMPVFNDAWMDSHRVLAEAAPSQQEEMMNPEPSPNMRHLPSIDEMTKHVLYQENPFPADDDGSDEMRTSAPRRNAIDEEKKDHHSCSANMDSYSWYEYDDFHPSNANRFFLLNGMASSSNGRGPLLLPEVAAAGLCQLQAKSRLQAEEEMTRSPLFEQFVNAVESKGFFEDPENSIPKDDPKEEEERLVLQKAVYDERMAKVVSKFRNKLAAKVDLQGESGSMMTQMLAYHHERRMRRVLHARKLKTMGLELKQNPVPPQIRASSMHIRGDAPMGLSPLARALPTPPASGRGMETQAMERQAEMLKSEGNAYMQKKEYDAALECYTKALKLSPSGPQSHVYFSNRAAALLSMKRFDQAILDSERALALHPTYGKAHARLGLAHFLLGDYRHAMEAYTVALKYEPDNKSSQAYLEKAAKKLAAAYPEEGAPAIHGSSFSVVSEWDKSNSKEGNRVRTSRRNSGSGVNDYRNTRSAPKSSQKGGGTRVPKVPTGKGSEEAERHKTLGNTHMANREYEDALEEYSMAIELSPSGPQSHVYYSNRAAALCYLERYLEAANDSEQALELKPTYGKAYARLGLARFFLHDYEGAIFAYTSALKYDPDNAASKSYLAKAKAKLEQQRQEDDGTYVTEDARRLMDDPDMILMAKKVMSSRGKSEAELLQDPEMQMITRKAMADPTMIEAIQSIRHVGRPSLSTSTSQ
ncbi:trypsin-like serine protease [Nitzschia inconspicua]|uniref:Trypsin-like serine protease n=1 Tax=Nitzschia inconspicua TaxID=303405 RepID=A0A9K3Q5N7_9STRA|nr:trypsin-like serine protease [Nitzschia inconspicua]